MSLPDVQATARPRIRHVAEFAAWLVLAAGMWIYSYSFDTALSTYALGPVAWPRAVIVLTALTIVAVPELLDQPDVLDPGFHKAALALVLFYFGSR